jgi:hypothetical protein
MFKFRLVHLHHLLKRLQRCQKCTDVQLAMDPVDEQRYEDPRDAFDPAQTSENNWPDYWREGTVTNSDTVSILRSHIPLHHTDADRTTSMGPASMRVKVLASRCSRTCTT